MGVFVARRIRARGRKTGRDEHIDGSAHHFVDELRSQGQVAPGMTGFHQDRPAFDMALVFQSLPEGLEIRAVGLFRREAQEADDRQSGLRPNRGRGRKKGEKSEDVPPSHLAIQITSMGRLALSEHDTEAKAPEVACASVETIHGSSWVLSRDSRSDYARTDKAVTVGGRPSSFGRSLHWPNRAPAMFAPRRSFEGRDKGRHQA